MTLEKHFDGQSIDPLDLKRVRLILEGHPISDYLRVLITNPSFALRGWLSEIYVTQEVVPRLSSGSTCLVRRINIQQLALYEIAEGWVHNNGVVVERNVTEKVALRLYKNPLPPNIKFVNGRAELLEGAPIPLDNLIRIIGNQYFIARMRHLAAYN
ncbi:hypothetical protein HYX03_04630 [Candidatus Woesearchaeota archaeon]|nr:hypothetical protein [Candidatus Woesearchaeota archaeon]